MGVSSVMKAVVMMVLPLLVLTSETVINPVIPLEGDSFLLECDGDGPMQYFLLHQKGEALAVGVHEELQIEVFDNATVHFESVSVSHEGTHLCLRGDQRGAVKGYAAPMQVRPLPPDDLWEEVYKTKFITGFLAALVVAAMFALGCLVYHYRWQPFRETDAGPILASSSGYENPAMTKGDDVESNCSTNF